MRKMLVYKSEQFLQFSGLCFITLGPFHCAYRFICVCVCILCVFRWAVPIVILCFFSYSFMSYYCNTVRWTW